MNDERRAALLAAYDGIQVGLLEAAAVSDRRAFSKL
jgi:hypothetical protein